MGCIFVSRRKRRNFSGEFKQTVVEDLLQNQPGYKAIARKYDIDDKMVARWEKTYIENGVEGLYKENKQGKKHRTFSAEFKKAVIDDLIENKRNYKETADIYDLNPQMIEKWERVYKEEGYEGLNRKSGNRTHLTGEFKQKIIEDMHQNKLGYEKTAAIYGVNIQKIAQWERIYLEEGRAGLNKKKRVHAVLEGSQILDKQVEEDLIAEVQRLRMENEYLKKLNALVHQKKSSVRKKKQQ